MVARARNAVPDARFLVGDIIELPLPDDDVDNIVCWR
jgi:ubiquinone/menaquinone biosynthesis C-methylase UbiE